MAATIQTISGPYTVTWGGVTLGITEDGLELEHVGYAEPVRGDNLGDSKQDGVYRGGDVFINFVLQEYSKTLVANGHTVAPWHPYHATYGRVGQVGVLQSNQAAQLLFSAVAGTPAANNPAAVRVYSAILAENFPIRLLFASRHRKIPMRMQALPDDYPGFAAWYGFE